MTEKNPWRDAPAEPAPEAPPAAEPTATTTLPKVSPQNPWRDSIKADALSDEITKQSGLADDLRNFFKFGGHGAARGLMETLGFPVDTYNAARYYMVNHPEAMAVGMSEGMISAEDLDIAKKAQAEVDSGKGPKADPVYAGSTRSFRDVASNLGINTKSPEEEGTHSGWAEWGDTLGEFGGANLPFVALAPEKMVIGGTEKVVTNLRRILSMEGKQGAKAAATDVVMGAIGPGTGAAVGQEFAGPDHKEEGKAFGSLIGGLRFPLISGGLGLAKSGASWVHDALGLGTGARAKVGEAITSSLQRPAEAAANMENKLPMSPGAQIPTDIQAGDEGLIALRRLVMKNDALLSGQYHAMQNATERAIEADTKLQRGNFASTQDFLEAKKKDFEDLAQKRLMQAQQQAERDVDTALSHAQANPNDAVLAKQAYALTLRNQLLHARDDLNAVTEAKWAKVNKTVPVETHGLYDELKIIQNEHESRPGQSKASFPSEVIDNFYNTGKDGKTPKFGPGTKLQDAIDLDSNIKQQMRAESAKDAPDRVRQAYLTRISKALGRVKESAPNAATDPAMKDAINATKYFHQTFSQGPVGEVLGHEVTGATAITPGDTIKHFISQGPGGVDSMDALVKAMKARGGQAHPMMPTSDMPTMVRNHIRQDFYDATMANGHFNLANARRWMQNNSAPLTHFGDLRKEFESAIGSEGGHRATSSLVEKRKDIDSIRANNVDLFLADPGKLFNGALEARDQVAATNKLLELTRQDPTGRATEGLIQKAFDHMWQTSQVDNSTTVAMKRLHGGKLNTWVEDNKGVIKALDKEVPGTKERFERIANTAKYLERFRVHPELPTEPLSFAAHMMNATNTVARIAGANIFSRFGHGGGSIQTASIGSQVFKKLAESLTPQQATKIFRQAMVEPELFKALTTEVTEKNKQELFRGIQPFLYSMGIPVMQPDFKDSAPKSRTDKAQPAKPQSPSLDSLREARP
jgi:hypothetical protein